MSVIAVRIASERTRARRRDCARFTSAGGRPFVFAFVGGAGNMVVNVDVGTGIGIGIVNGVLVSRVKVSWDLWYMEMLREKERRKDGRRKEFGDYGVGGRGKGEGRETDVRFAEVGILGR